MNECHIKRFLDECDFYSCIISDVLDVTSISLVAPWLNSQEVGRDVVVTG